MLIRDAISESRHMDSATVDAAVSDLRAVVEDFLDELADRDLSADRLGEIIEGDEEFEGADLRQFPERFVEDHLIWPVLDVLGYVVTPRPDSPSRTREEYPDFRVGNLPATASSARTSRSTISRMPRPNCLTTFTILATSTASRPTGFDGASTRSPKQMNATSYSNRLSNPSA